VVDINAIQNIAQILCPEFDNSRKYLLQMSHKAFPVQKQLVTIQKHIPDFQLFSVFCPLARRGAKLL
jgi:hypothetical protein